MRVFDNSLVQFWGKKEDFGLLRARFPIPMHSQGYYFTIEVVHTNDDECVLDIGVTSKGLKSKSIGFGKMVEISRDGSGFRKFPYSFGYSSSGIIYGTSTPEKMSQKQTYSAGDVIGCYVDNIDAICCFTKNGILLNKLIHLTNADEPLFPTIAFSSNGTIINSCFSETKFEFDKQGINELESFNIK